MDLTMKIGIKFVLPYSQDKGDERLKQSTCHLLKVRFGFLDEELSGIVEPMLQLPLNDYSSLLLQLSSLSREDLLARFPR
jgi:hypothetical protein